MENRDIEVIDRVGHDPVWEIDSERGGFYKCPNGSQ